MKNARFYYLRNRTNADDRPMQAHKPVDVLADLDLTQDVKRWATIAPEKPVILREDETIETYLTWLAGMRGAKIVSTIRKGVFRSYVEFRDETDLFAHRMRWT